MNIRQCVVVRRDLDMKPGFLAAQVAHISAQFMMDKIQFAQGFSQTHKAWCANPYLYVYGVNDVEELLELEKRAKKQSVLCYMWADTIWSPDLKCDMKKVIGASFGPDDSDALKRILGSLTLLT